MSLKPTMSLSANVNLGHEAGTCFTFTYTGSDARDNPGSLIYRRSLMAARVPVRLTEDMPIPIQVGDALTVTVMEAAAGSGMVSIAPMASVAAGSGGNEITVTYTADRPD